MSDDGLNLFVLEESSEDWELSGDGSLGVIRKSLVFSDVSLGEFLKRIKSWLISGEVLLVEFTSLGDDLLDKSLSGGIEFLEFSGEESLELSSLLVKGWRLFLESSLEFFLGLVFLVVLGEFLKSSLLLSGDGLEVLGNFSWDESLVLGWDVVEVLWNLWDWGREDSHGGKGYDEEGAV